MLLNLLVGLILFLPGDGNADQFPLALHRSMEIDDLDREIARIHDSVLLKNAQLQSSKRLAQKGLFSRADLEREIADAKYQEALEAETISYRAIKAYERDVSGQAAVSDEKKGFTLVLDWVRKRAAMAQIDLDFKTYQVKQSRALFAKNAISRQELDEAELGYNAALAGLELSRSREAQVLMELDTRNGEKVYDDEAYHKLREDYLRSRLRYFEINLEGAKRRLSLARERSKLKMISDSEVDLIQKAYDDMAANVDAEKKALEAHLAEKPASPPKSRGTTVPPKRGKVTS